MKEVHPGVLHWTRKHPKIGIDVSSYFLVDERVLIDPLMPEEGIDELPEKPEEILLTNRHHYRDSGRLAERLGCTVRCVEQGLQEFGPGERVQGFRFGDVLRGGILALEVGVICPDETALLIPRAGGLLAVADGVVRHENGPLSFVPDDYLGKDPDDIKVGLREAYRRLLERDFDHLLPAHGWPWIGGAKAALREFVEA